MNNIEERTDSKIENSAAKDAIISGLKLFGVLSAIALGVFLFIKIFKVLIIIGMLICFAKVATNPWVWFLTIYGKK